MGDILTAEQDKIFIGQLVELLNEHRRAKGIGDETIERLAYALLARLHQQEQALTSGDITMNTYAKELHQANLKRFEEQAHAAEVLLQAGTMETEEIKKQLENIKQLARHMPMIICASSNPTTNSLPKLTRTYLCMQIMITWKDITGVEEIPRRTRVPDGEFHDFIQSILSLYDGSVAKMDTDNLHKDILKVEKELRRLTTENDDPKVEWVEL